MPPNSAWRHRPWRCGRWPRPPFGGTDSASARRILARTACDTGRPPPPPARQPLKPAQVVPARAGDGRPSPGSRVQSAQSAGPRQAMQAVGLAEPWRDLVMRFAVEEVATTVEELSGTARRRICQPCGGLFESAAPSAERSVQRPGRHRPACAPGPPPLPAPPPRPHPCRCPASANLFAATRRPQRSSVPSPRARGARPRPSALGPRPSALGPRPSATLRRPQRATCANLSGAPEPEERCRSEYDARGLLDQLTAWPARCGSAVFASSRPARRVASGKHVLPLASLLTLAAVERTRMSRATPVPVQSRTEFRAEPGSLTGWGARE